MNEELFITGAGVSASSGIPTFRGNDGFWTVGSKNYTPQEMATRWMYENNPADFLLWYFKRFASYRNVKPNLAHYWLADKKLITQNIDGLDGRAGNTDYISVHGRLDKVVYYRNEMDKQLPFDAKWDEIEITSTSSNYDNEKINDIVLSIQGQDLLSLDLNDIKSSIRSDSWIRDVEIKKSFPDKLEIIIIPQEPYAIYNSKIMICLLYTSPSPRDSRASRNPSCG